MKTPREVNSDYARLLDRQERLSRDREKAVIDLTRETIKNPTGRTGSVRYAGHPIPPQMPGIGATPSEVAAFKLQADRARKATPPSDEAQRLTDIDEEASQVAAEIRHVAPVAANEAVAFNAGELRKLVSAAARDLSNRFESMAAIYVAREELASPFRGVPPAAPTLYGDRLGLGEAVKQLTDWHGGGWLALDNLTPSMRRIVEATNPNSYSGEWGQLLRAGKR